MSRIAHISDRPPPNPRAVVLRLKALKAITQLKGDFAIVGAPSGVLGADLGEQMRAEAADSTSIRVLAEYAFAGSNEASDGARTPFVQISATFAVDYELEDGEAFSPEDAQAFADVNGRFNTYPFWREYVRDCLARANLPTFLVPLFNPVKALRDRDRAAAGASD